jgi:hypothetical protein
MAEGFIVVRRTRDFSRSGSLISKKHYSVLTSEKKSLGDWSDRGTPGHIPNPVVKAVSADGTWGATPRESRSSPRDFSLSHLDP